MSNKQGREYIMKADCCFLVQITGFFMSSEGATFRITEWTDPEYLSLSYLLLIWKLVLLCLWWLFSRLFFTSSLCRLQGDFFTVNIFLAGREAVSSITHVVLSQMYILISKFSVPWFSAPVSEKDTVSLLVLQRKEEVESNSKCIY